MLITNYTVRYTPEKTCKWCQKNYENLYYCKLKARHRNLGKCKICTFGHYK